jgi:hypothetical protein
MLLNYITCKNKEDSYIILRRKTELIMDIISKYKLLEKLMQTQDDALLDQVKVILIGSDKDFWEDLDTKTQESILRGKAQSLAGNTRPHQQVINEINARFIK